MIYVTTRRNKINCAFPKINLELRIEIANIRTRHKLNALTKRDTGSFKNKPTETNAITGKYPII